MDQGVHGPDRTWPREAIPCPDRHDGREKKASNFDDRDAALAEKQRIERAQREGRRDEYAAGLQDETSSEITLREIMALWFKEDAAPNLAEATLANYLQIANKWIQPIGGSWPLRAFEQPKAVNERLAHALVQGVPRYGPRGEVTTEIDPAGAPTRDRTRKILSPALTWGVEHHFVRRRSDARRRLGVLRHIHGSAPSRAGAQDRGAS